MVLLYMFIKVIMRKLGKASDGLSSPSKFANEK